MGKLGHFYCLGLFSFCFSKIDERFIIENLKNIKTVDKFKTNSYSYIIYTDDPNRHKIM